MTRFADDTRFWEIKPSSQITMVKGGGDLCRTQSRSLWSSRRTSGCLGPGEMRRCIAWPGGVLEVSRRKRLFCRNARRSLLRRWTFWGCGWEPVSLAVPLFSGQSGGSAEIISPSEIGRGGTRRREGSCQMYDYQTEWAHLEGFKLLVSLDSIYILRFAIPTPGPSLLYYTHVVLYYCLQ